MIALRLRVDRDPSSAGPDLLVSFTPRRVLDGAVPAIVLYRLVPRFRLKEPMMSSSPHSHSSALAPRVLLSGLAYVESPRWHEDRLWFAHWGAEEIVAVDLDGKREVVAPGRP